MGDTGKSSEKMQKKKEKGEKKEKKQPPKNLFHRSCTVFNVKWFSTLWFSWVGSVSLYLQTWNITQVLKIDLLKLLVMKLQQEMAKWPHMKLYNHNSVKQLVSSINPKQDECHDNWLVHNQPLDGTRGKVRSNNTPLKAIYSYLPGCLTQVNSDSLTNTLDLEIIFSPHFSIFFSPHFSIFSHNDSESHILWILLKSRNTANKVHL